MISKDTFNLINPTTYRFGEFRLETENLLLFRNSKVVPLAPKACEVLLALVESNGKLLTKQEILDRVWANTFVEEANLTHHVSALRKALGEDKNGRKFIETIPRKGYRFVAEVKNATASEGAEITINERALVQFLEETTVETDDAATAQIEDETGGEPERLAFTQTGTGRALIIGGLCLLAVIGASAAWRIWISTAPRPAFFDDSTRSRWRVAPVVEGKSRQFGKISNINFAPDGKFVAFNQTSGGKSAIFVKQIGGGAAVRLTDGKWLDSSPVWSADAARVAFLSNRDNFTGVWAIPSFGGTPVLLGKLPFSPQIPTQLLKLSADGNRVYYSAEMRLYAQDLRDAAAAPKLIYEPDAQFADAGDFAVSPDESRFAFYADTNGEIQLFTGSTASGDAPVQITSGAGEKRNPAWFASGRQIVFSSNQSGTFQIYALDTDSGEVNRLTMDAADNSEPSATADNRAILFHSTKDEANVYSLQLESLTETALTASTGLQVLPRIAPDARRVAFQTSPSSSAVFQSDLKILPLDNSHQTLEVAKNGFDPQWSPDANSLAFVRSSGATFDLWKVSAFGQNETQITMGGINPTNFTFAPFEIKHINFNWSPDGRQLVYASFKSGAANVWTVSADGAADKQWTAFTGEATAVSDYYWSPDARKIAFFAQMKPPDEAASRAFRVCVTDGESTHAIYETKSAIRILGWSPDGLEIYAAERETNDETQEKSVSLMKISTSGDKNTQLIARLDRTDFDKLRLSPDAQKVVFTRFDEQTKSENLYLLPISGGAPERLTDNRDSTVYYSGANFSSDGKKLFYSKQTGGDVYALLTISE